MKDSLLSGLDNFGLNDFDQKDLFPDQEENSKVKKINLKQEPEEKDFLYIRNLACPVCGTVIQTPTVKQGSSKLIDIGLNLRPRYENINTFKYDVVHCEVCGYTSLNRNFKKVSDRQIKMIREKISVKFVGRKYPEVFTYDDVLERYKMAIYNSIVMGSSDVDKAYLCLKASWITECMLEEAIDEATIEALSETRDSYEAFAYKGFVNAYSSVAFPVYGMSEATYQYLMAYLAYRVGEKKETSRWLSRVLLSPNANKRIKDKARELREYMELKKEEEAGA